MNQNIPLLRSNNFPIDKIANNKYFLLSPCGLHTKKYMHIEHVHGGSIV